ncbi:hypothetical protein KI387_033373, partial [Taxus chinensis]
IVEANEFTVGGKNGWAAPTGSEHETFNQWAERLRFHVGDTILFKYTATEDSVLQVTQEAFQKCNTTSPVASFDDGHTAFKFPNSGPFYFISGAQGHCEKGQKIVVVVMSQGGRRSSGISPAPSPSDGNTNEEVPASSPSGNPAVAPTSDAPAAASVLSGVLSGVAALAAVMAF